MFTALLLAQALMFEYVPGRYLNIGNVSVLHDKRWAWSHRKEVVEGKRLEIHTLYETNCKTGATSIGASFAMLPDNSRVDLPFERVPVEASLARPINYAMCAVMLR